MKQSLLDWQAIHNISDEAMKHLSLLLHIENPPRDVTGDQRAESAIQAHIRIESHKTGNPLWRNNVGAALDDKGRHVRYGLGNDSKRLSQKWTSSDLIGITQVKAEYVGQTFGVFTAVEVKKSDWRFSPNNRREQAQLAFLQSVRALNGISMFANSIDHYKDSIRGKTK